MGWGVFTDAVVMVTITPTSSSGMLSHKLWIEHQVGKLFNQIGTDLTECLGTLCCFHHDLTWNPLKNNIALDEFLF